jgi:hypothetical protein
LTPKLVVKSKFNFLLYKYIEKGKMWIIAKEIRSQREWYGKEM